MSGFLEAIIAGFDARQNLIKIYKLLTGREKGFPLGGFSVISRKKNPTKYSNYSVGIIYSISESRTSHIHSRFHWTNGRKRKVSPKELACLVSELHVDGAAGAKVLSHYGYFRAPRLRTSARGQTRDCGSLPKRDAEDDRLRCRKTGQNKRPPPEEETAEISVARLRVSSLSPSKLQLFILPR